MYDVAAFDWWRKQAIFCQLRTECILFKEMWTEKLAAAGPSSKFVKTGSCNVQLS